jgi:hypothetical protein
VVALMVWAKRLIRTTVALLERLGLPLTMAALRATVALLLLAALAKGALLTPRLAVVGMAVMARGATATGRPVPATTRAV